MARNDSVPTLWRLHMVHHADLDQDLATALRFRYIKIVISVGIKLMSVVPLGLPVLSVFIFEIALNVGSMFNHSNLRPVIPVDWVLRVLVVPPNMHRVHHSVIIRETTSNYGFSLPWWERIFGTHKGQSDRGHDGMTIGVSQFRDPAKLTFPFIGDPGRVPINRQ